MSLCVCVCVCVCEREREKQRERGAVLSFTWDLTEDYSPGDSLSDSSEEPLRRGKGRARVYMNFFVRRNM